MELRKEGGSTVSESNPNQPWTGKLVSILGASIETLEGWNPPGYAVFYTEERAKLSGISTPEDTWWGQVIARMGGQLLVDNAWSGSRVTRMPGSDQDFPSACSLERVGGLHTAYAIPDVILIHMGGNDFGYGVPIRRRGFQKGNKLEFYSKAYCTMLRRLRKNYPKAELWCMGIGKTFMSARPEFVFPDNFCGVLCHDYNHIIKRAADHFGGNYIDLYHNGIYDTIDGTHPTKDGMVMLADLVYKEIVKETRQNP